MSTVDQYQEEVIRRGDDMSSCLEKVFAPTLKNSKFADIVSQGMNGIKVIRPPKGHLAIVHSLAGDSNNRNDIKYSASVVDRLVLAAVKIGAKPIALANVIDARAADKEIILPMAESLANASDFYRLAVVNGEFAVLGDRLSVPANISATMLSFVPASSNLPVDASKGIFNFEGVEYAVFDPEEKPIYMNSDGVGTKVEFYERLYRPVYARKDSLAMKLDDSVKIGATARVVSDVCEVNMLSHFPKGERNGWTLDKDGKCVYIVQYEEVGNRIVPYKPGKMAFNLSGSAVSTIDEIRLKKQLTPHQGEYLVAIRGKPNPRSNGITDKRKIMVELFGNDWHKTSQGRNFMEYLAEPSTIFYEIFTSLIDSGLATSVYHMSGGSFNGKLARPLAKSNLFIEMKDLFAPDERELALVRARNTPFEVAYAKWPMGTEGFITTARPEEAIVAIQSYRSIYFGVRDLEARTVGQLELSKDGRTGVELSGVKSSNGENVYYSGRD